MLRQRLMVHKGLSLTGDTVNALKALEEGAHKLAGWRVQYHKPEPAEDRALSLLPAGREVWLSLVHPEASPTPQRALEALWGFAVPLGFTPLSRYPLMGHGSNVFHFLGPWTPLYDRLLAEGRGHLAWPSVCCAAQVDIGVWQGDKEQARFIQAQLHRVGLNVGPVDGVVGARTTAAIETLGLQRPSLAAVAVSLQQAEPPAHPSSVRGKGHVVIPGKDLSIVAYGGVTAVRTTHGASLDIRGPGRLIVDIKEV